MSNVTRRDPIAIARELLLGLAGDNRITVRDAWYEPTWRLGRTLGQPTELEQVIGRKFDSVADARTAARAVAEENRPIILTIGFPDGSRKDF